MKTLLKILGGIVLFFVIVAFIVLKNTAGVEESAEAILAKFQEGKVEEVYTNSLLPQQMTFEVFKQALDIGGEYDFSKAKKISWEGRGFENSEIYIYGSFTFPNGKKETMTYWFIENDDNTFTLSGITLGTPGKE